MAITDSKEDWFWYPVHTPVRCNFALSYSASSILPLIQDRCCYCVCLWTSKLVASTDSERRLVQALCTDPGAVKFHVVLYGLLHFACWFKTGVVNVYVCGLASWWQVQSQKEDWFRYLVQTLVWCTFTWLYLSSTILPFNSRQVSSMCVFVDWPVDDK